MVDVREVKVREPERARIMKSVICDLCGEAVMETRTVPVNGKKACIPCAENIKNKIVLTNKKWARALKPQRREIHEDRDS